MSRQPLVSVIIPAYNAERYIQETLDSVLAQTYSDFEALVVDDGSQDATAEIVARRALGEPKITLLRQPNRGVAAARNWAIQNAKGEFIAILDSDDAWFPTKLEKQVRCLEQAGAEVGVVYCWYAVMNEQGQVTGFGPRWDLEGEVLAGLVMHNFIGNGSVPLFRRSCLQMAGCFNTTMHSLDAQGCEDWEICLRLAEICEFRVIQECLVGYRFYNSNMSGNYQAMGKSHDLMLEAVERRHPEIGKKTFRWARGNFYVYLASRSSQCGDVYNTFRWLRRALWQDPAVLLLGWANMHLLKGGVRWLATPLARLLGLREKLWMSIRQHRKGHPVLAENWKQISEPAEQPRGWVRPWDRLQIRRWAKVTNYRSYSC